MQNFEFHNPVKIIFGKKDELSKLATLVDKSQKVLLVYGGGSIFKNGVYDGVKSALVNHTVLEFGGIEPNPHFETAMKVVEIIKAEKVDFVLAIGGGSVIDAVKFIVSAALYEGTDAWDILAKGVEVKAALPFGAVLTLPATGSEMNSGSVITKAATEEKFAFMSVHSFPKFSFLLPDAAGSLPKKQVANGVVDAFVHVMEQYMNYPAGAPLNDRFAESILQTLIEEGPKVYAKPDDYEAMSNLMWSATMALNGLIGCGVPQDWATHMIGHELTAFHGIDHARTLAIVLPGLWTVLKEEKRAKLLQYGARVWGITEGTEEERVLAAIAKTEEFFQSLGLPTKLGDYGVTSITIDKIVTRFEQRQWKAIGDRGLVTPIVVRQTLEHQLA
ncbi:MAG: iron-containing alcohol dehydrogenase [Bacteroidales bacterium]|nr:iron-containing alcohol dehydrogenase [Bacteroidales bacterium]